MNESNSSTSPEDHRVILFYSSRTDPDLPKRCEDFLTVLSMAGITAKLVDIIEHPDLAHELEVTTTPTLLVDKGGDAESYIGVAGNLRRMVLKTIYNPATLYHLSRKEGHRLAHNKGLHGERDKNAVHTALTDPLAEKGIYTFTLNKFDWRNQNAVANLRSTLLDATPDNDITPYRMIESLLSGVFSVVFQSSIKSVNREKRSRSYTFTVHGDGVQEPQSTWDRVRNTLPF